MSVKPTLVDMAKEGQILSSRQSGAKAADKIAKAMAKGTVVVSFKAVQIATPTYLDEIVARMAGGLRKNEDTVVVLTQMNEEVHESLELIAGKRGVAIAELSDKQIELIGGKKQLDETLKAAQELGEFTAPELAEKLKIKLPALHQRLQDLMEAGVVTREPDKSSKRGRPHGYSTPDPKKLSDSKQLIRA